MGDVLSSFVSGISTREAEGSTVHIEVRTEAGLVVDDAPGPSSREVRLLVRRFAPIDRPVGVALLLKSFGLGLAAAHAVLNRIVADEEVSLVLEGMPASVMVDRLAKLGVGARVF